MGDSERLLPAKDALEQYFMSMNYQASIWFQCDKVMQILNEPTDHGWKLIVDSSLAQLLELHLFTAGEL